MKHITNEISQEWENGPKTGEQEKVLPICQNSSGSHSSIPPLGAEWAEDRSTRDTHTPLLGQPGQICPTWACHRPLVWDTPGLGGWGWGAETQTTQSFLPQNILEIGLLGRGKKKNYRKNENKVHLNMLWVFSNTSIWPLFPLPPPQKKTFLKSFSYKE